MVWILFIVASVAVASDLPEPEISSGDGIEFSIEAVPGTRFIEVRYGEKDDIMAGPFHQTVTGQWVHHNKKFHATEGIKYQVHAVKDGQYVQYPASGFKEWAPEQQTALLPPKKVVRRASVVLREDFNSGTRPNPANWDYEVSMYGGYNWEIQVYTNDPLNAFVKNGHLYLKPTLTSQSGHFTEAQLHTAVMDVRKIWGTCTNADRWGCSRDGHNGILPPVQSAKLKSKRTIKYGKVTLRAKVPKGDWLWPAMWMLPRNNVYGAWPRSGEIDIMESRGNSHARSGDGHDHGCNEVSSTLHWGVDAGHNRYTMTTGARQTGGCWGDSFHTWVLDWSDTHLTISVDGHVVNNVPTPNQGFFNWGHQPGSRIWPRNNSPFDQDFYLILNVAVGGTNGFFPDGWRYNTNKPWNNNSPHEGDDFWNARNSWLPTWKGDDVALQIDWLQMEQY